MSSDIFTGASRYSKDFQSVVDRAVAIASLPLTQMQSEGQALKEDSTALTSIDAKFAALASAVSSIESATGSPSYSATLSDPSLLSTSLSDGVKEGTYKVTVTGLGSYALASSSPAAGVADPATQNINSATNYSLVLNAGTASEQTFSLTATNLSDLADEINSHAGTDVVASLVNVGSADGDTNYTISIQSRHLRADTISLLAVPPEPAVPTELLTQSDSGSKVTYKINGAPEASSESRTITLSPGLNLDLKKADLATEVTVSVARTTSSIKSSLQSFVGAYNLVVAELDNHRGENKGALAGGTIASTLAQELAQLTAWSSGSGKLQSLRDIGLELGSDGKLTFNDVVFAKASKDAVAELVTFLGSKSSGGFLKAANDHLDTIEDTDSGILKAAISINQSSTTRSDERIAAEQKRIDDLRDSLMTQISTADALIASLEQQASYISGMFESMRIASESMR